MLSLAAPGYPGAGACGVTDHPPEDAPHRPPCGGAHGGKAPVGGTRHGGPLTRVRPVWMMISWRTHITKKIIRCKHTDNCEEEEDEADEKYALDNPRTNIQIQDFLEKQIIGPGCEV